MNASSPPLHDPGPALPAEWQPLHRQLLELRERVLRDRREVATGTRDLSLDGPSDFEEVGALEEDRELSYAMLHAEDDMLAEIDAALVRMEKGTYGICQRTGQAIPLARLKAMPWTRFTREAKADLERMPAHGWRGRIPRSA